MSFGVLTSLAQAVLLLLLATHMVSSFSVLPRHSCFPSNAQTALYENTQDVSDLGLSMDDLNAPLPPELVGGIATSGYESTSRIPLVQDDACKWTETSSGQLQATLAIPGLRGQPAACLAVLFATQTVSVTAFGRVVWSCILKGEIDPESSTFQCREGDDMVPVIELQVTKAKPKEKRWGGLILQIGEDSIL